MSTLQINTLQTSFAHFFDEIDQLIDQNKKSKQLLSDLQKQNKHALSALCARVDSISQSVTKVSIALEGFQRNPHLSVKVNSIELEVENEDKILLIQQQTQVSLANIPELKRVSRSLSFQNKVKKLERALKQLNKNIHSTQKILNQVFTHDEWERQMYRDIESGRFETAFPLESSDSTDLLYERIK